MWETGPRHRSRQHGGAVHIDRRVVRIEHDGVGVTAVRRPRLDGRRWTRYEGPHFLSTLPIRDLIRPLDPPPPPEVVDAAESLKYRDFLTVVLIVDRAETFPDNWIYIHEPDVRVGRIQNFKNWSPDLVPTRPRRSLGLEYFCFEGDDLWTMSDADLIALGRARSTRIGLVPPAEVVDGCVVRMPKAYPVYDDAYQAHLAVIRAGSRTCPTSSWPAATACTSTTTRTTR